MTGAGDNNRHHGFAKIQNANHVLSLREAPCGRDPGLKIRWISGPRVRVGFVVRQDGEPLGLLE